MNNLTLHLYTESECSLAVKNYQLSNQINSQHPEEVIRTSKDDPARYPVGIYDKQANLVGFMCLHVGASPDFYDMENENYVLLRSMSIDDRYQGQGVGTESLRFIFDFISKEIDSHITDVVLAVNEKNIGAQKCYEKAGFTPRPEKKMGRLGWLIVMDKSR